MFHHIVYFSLLFFNTSSDYYKFKRQEYTYIKERIDHISYVIRIRSTSSLQCKQQEQEQKSEYLYQFLEFSCSFFFTVYPFIMYLPIQRLCIKLIIDKSNCEIIYYQFAFLIVLSTLVLTGNILLIILSINHNFFFSFKDKDWLLYYRAMPTQLQIFFHFIILFIINLIHCLNINQSTFTLLNILFLLPLLLIGIWFPIYNYKLIDFLKSITLIIIILISIINALFSQLLHLNYSLIIILLFPFLIIITIKLDKCFINNDLFINSEYFDYYQKQKYQECKKLLSNNGILLNESNQLLPQNLELYSYVVKHLINCQNKTKCFCKQFNLLEESFKSRMQFKYFIKCLIRFHYEQKIQTIFDFKIEQINRKFSNSLFYYILYLSEIVKEPTKAFHELVNLRIRFLEYVNLKLKMKVFLIQRYVKLDFLRMIKLKNIVNQKYNCQKVFIYYICIKEWKSQFLKGLELQCQWNNMLLLSNNIHQIINEGILLYKYDEKLENDLKILFQCNISSSECQIMIQLFYKLIFFNKTPLNIPRLDSIEFYNFLNSTESLLFHQDASLVFITLIGQVGLIKQYTNQFTLTVQSSEAEILNQSINNYIPNIIAEVHDEYLINFVEKGRINIMQSENRFLLVKNKKGFIFPIIAKIRLETNLPDDFGASALILPAYCNFHYILLNSYGLIEEISEKLFQQIIKRILNITIDKVQQIDCLKLIPRLIKVWKQFNALGVMDSQFKEIQQSYIIIPKKVKKQIILINTQKTIQISPSEYLQQQDLKNESYFDDQSDVFMFKITFKILEFQTFKGNIHCLEIQTIKSVQKSERKEIYEKLVEKADYQMISRKAIQIIKDKKIKNGQSQQKQTFDIISFKGSLGHISHNQSESLNVCNLDSLKIIEDEFMIQQKEKQFKLINPDYEKESIYMNEDTNFFFYNSQEQQEKRILAHQKQRRKVTLPFTTFNHFNSNHSNGLSQMTSNDYNKMIQSSAILEALNDNLDSVKSQHSLIASASQDNFLQDLSCIRSNSYSQTRKIAKKSKLKNAIFGKVYQLQRILNWLIFLIFLVGIINNILYYYFLLQERSVIEEHVFNFNLFTKFKENIQIYLLIYNQQIDNFDMKLYIQQNIFDFEENIENSYQHTISILLQNQIYSNFEYKNNDNMSNISFFYILTLFSEEMVIQQQQNNFPFLFYINYLEIEIQFQKLNTSLVQEWIIQHNQAQLNIYISCYFSIFCIFIGVCFYFISFMIIKRNKGKIVKIFNTISKSQIKNQIESLQSILIFCESINFKNCTITEKDFDQMKFKKSSYNNQLSPHLKSNINEEKTLIDSLIYLMIFFFSFILLCSQYLGSIIYQETYQNVIQTNFEAFQLYKTIEQLIITQLAFQKIYAEMNLNSENYFSDCQLYNYMQREFLDYKYSIYQLNNINQENLFSTTFNIDGCNIFTQLTTQSQDQFFNESICLQQQVLNKGLYLYFISILQNFEEFYQLFDSSTKSIQQIINIEENLKNQILNTLISNYILNLLIQQAMYTIQNIINLNYLINSIIFSYGIFCLLFFLFIGTNKLKTNFDQQFTKPKLLFQLIPINILTENPYIMQYLLTFEQQIEQ